MKKIISLLCVACLAFAVACSDDKEVDQAFDSVLTPDFTFDDSEEIIAGVDAVQFIDNSKAEGTEISGYFWHFGFAGLGNWSEEAAPAPVMYKDAGEYTVTLTVYGADGNSRSTKRTIVVKAANLAPSASFSYTPETVVVDTEVTFTDTSVDSDGEIVARRWTLPDNTTSTDASVKYTFTKGGTFSVTLRVTDDRGASSEVSKAVYVAGGESSGSGTADDPWVIATADRWNEIAASINGTQPGDYKVGDYYLVTNDVDFSGKNFIAWDSFSGQLTGNGNSLKGITATYTVAEADINADAAIFGVIRINSGTVKDLKIEATLTSNGNRIGGMTGRNNGTLDGVYFVKGTLTGV
ncbi:MAG: PKD domain-containing protein, partial [Alistipes senegalensis]|nr:PKD domain-containing protein [Alistipes senegalensis]